MLRPDGFTNKDVGNGKYPDGAEGGDVMWTLPALGPESPNAVAIRLLMKASFFFGGYALFLRLVGLASIELAFILSRLVAAVFAMIMVTAWLAPRHGKKDWPVWVGAVLLVIYFGQYLFSADGNVPWGAQGASWQFILQVLIGTIFLVSVLSPVVKNVGGNFSLGQSVVGVIAALEGATLGVKTYVPESPFGTWNLFPIVMLFTYVVSAIIADQYGRFQEAANFKQLFAESPELVRWIDRYTCRAHPLAIAKLTVALWVGNWCFLATLWHPYANLFGFFAFIATMAMLTSFGTPEPYGFGAPYRFAWDALCFWLTYNWQRISHPNVFQCRLPYREPLVRAAIVGVPLALLAILVLHLGGLHADPNQARFSPEPFMWNRLLPQSYLTRDHAGALPDAAKAVYVRHAAAVTERGESQLTNQRMTDSLTQFVVSIFVALLTAPLLLVFIIATTEGNRIAAAVHQLEGEQDASQI